MSVVGPGPSPERSAERNTPRAKGARLAQPPQRWLTSTNGRVAGWTVGDQHLGSTVDGGRNPHQCRRPGPVVVGVDAGGQGGRPAAGTVVVVEGGLGGPRRQDVVGQYRRQRRPQRRPRPVSAPGPGRGPGPPLADGSPMATFSRTWTPGAGDGPSGPDRWPARRTRGSGGHPPGARPGCTGRAPPRPKMGHRVVGGCPGGQQQGSSPAGPHGRVAAARSGTVGQPSHHAVLIDSQPGTTGQLVAAAQYPRALLLRRRRGCGPGGRAARPGWPPPPVDSPVRSARRRREGTPRQGSGTGVRSGRARPRVSRGRRPGTRPANRSTEARVVDLDRRARAP